MKIKYIIFTIILTIAFGACDKIDTPMKEGVTTWNGRKIVIYDFTGHKCPNCPDAHKEIERLVDLYGEAVVPIAIHCSRLSNPYPLSNKFYYDFRTDIGIYLGGDNSSFGFYNISALPTGLVNNLGANSLNQYSNWAAETAKYMSLYPEFSISISPSYSSSDNTVSCDIFVNTEIKNSRKLGLIAFLLEDDIIQWQSTTSGDIENYEHSHVLRAGFNGTWGEEIKNNTNESSVGNEYRKSYTLSAGDDWVINNCSVVAFVYDTETKEILQAEISHLHE